MILEFWNEERAMSLLSIARQMLRAMRHQRALQSMTELDDRTLADIGLLRADVHAALARPYFADPAKVLKDACCRGRTVASRFRPGAELVACC
jgi:uncharacterized protein YjiS (DUF1127 family)